MSSALRSNQHQLCCDVRPHAGAVAAMNIFSLTLLTYFMLSTACQKPERPVLPPALVAVVPAQREVPPQLQNRDIISRANESDEEPPRLPWISFKQADQAIVMIQKNLRDGDLIPGCDLLLSGYRSNTDSFMVDHFPVTALERRVGQRYETRLHELLDACFGYLYDPVVALSELRRRVSKNPNKLVLQQNLSLVISRSTKAEQRREAQGLLEKLAKNSQISRAEGYAALARLRYQAGDPAGAKTALQRCAAMTVRTNVCPTDTELTSPQPPVPPPPSVALGFAWKSYRQGDYTQAIELARQNLGADPQQGWRIIGVSACQLHDRALAQEVFLHMDRENRQYLVYRCQRAGAIELGSTFSPAASRMAPAPR